MELIEFFNEAERLHGVSIRKKIENTQESKKLSSLFVCFCEKKSRNAELAKYLLTINNFGYYDRFKKLNYFINVDNDLSSPSLINKVLSELPDNVWYDEKIRWNLPTHQITIDIIKRLMNSLISFEPDDEKRYKYILENIIFVSETNIIEKLSWCLALNPKNELKINISENFDNMNIIIKDPIFNKSTNITKRDFMFMSLYDNGSMTAKQLVSKYYKDCYYKIINKKRLHIDENKALIQLTGEFRADINLSYNANYRYIIFDKYNTRTYSLTDNGRKYYEERYLKKVKLNCEIKL